MPKRNNILKFNDQFQRCTDENYTDIKSSYSHKKNPNTPIIDRNIFSKYTNSSEKKKNYQKALIIFKKNNIKNKSSRK